MNDHIIVEKDSSVRSLRIPSVACPAERPALGDGGTHPRRTGSNPRSRKHAIFRVPPGQTWTSVVNMSNLLRSASS
jgi:hypothetical protein